MIGVFKQTPVDPLSEIENFEVVNKIKTSHPEVFNLYRLIILSALYYGKIISFQGLKKLTKIETAGNLASHLRALEKLNLIEYHSGEAGRRKITHYSLTDPGKKEFEEVVINLGKFLLRT